MKKTAVFFLLALVLSSVASADIMVALNSGPVTNGANFNWTYTATLKSGSTLNSGDFFTIYDIGGITPTTPVNPPSIVPASWSSSVQLLGTNGFGQAPSDSASVYNITYTYSGTAVV